MSVWDGGTQFGCPPLLPLGRALWLLLQGCRPRKPSSALGSCVHPWASGGLAHVRLQSICPLQAAAFAFQLLPVLRGAQFYTLLCSETLSPRGSSLVHHHSVPRFLSLLRRKTKPSSRGGAAQPRRTQPGCAHKSLSVRRDPPRSQHPGAFKRWSLHSSHCHVTTQ